MAKEKSPAEPDRSGRPAKEPLLYWAGRDLPSDFRTYSGVPVSDCGRSAAKRESGRSGRSVWRYGFPDRLRTARIGDFAFESDDVVGNSVYADIDFALDCGYEKCGRHRGANAGTTRSACQRPEIGGSGGSDTCSGGSSSRAKPGTRAGSEEVVAYASGWLSGLRRWRNWQTH